jgi:hypothetical protein
MDAFDYSMLLPPVVAVLLSALIALRNPVNRNLKDFLGSSVMLTFLLGAVWLAGVFLFSLWREPKRVELWMASVLTGVAACFIARAVWRSLR